MFNKKFFKKINWWNFFFTILVILILIFIIKFFAKSEGKLIVRVKVSGGEWWYGTEDAPVWLNSGLKIGDEELGPDGKISAKILQIDQYPQGDEKSKMFLVVELSGFYDHRTGHFQYKGKPVLKTQSIEINFPKSRISGIVTHLGKNSFLERKKFKIRALLKNQEWWFVKNIKVGLQAFNGGNNQEIAKITKVVVRQPSSNIFIENVRGQIELSKDYQKKDVVLDMEILAERDDDIWLYAGHQKLKVGEPLWVYTKDLDLEWLEIMKIEEINE